VQFITALAPGRVEDLPDVQTNEFWWSFSRLAGQLAEKALREGIIPLDDPTIAYEVQPDVETAIRLARRERTVVHQGAVVWEFELGFAAVLRRAAAESMSVRVGLKNGERSGLWGVGGVDEGAGLFRFEVPVAGAGVTQSRLAMLDEIAWVEATDVPF
jgi:hypothetical protein